MTYEPRGIKVGDLVIWSSINTHHAGGYGTVTKVSYRGPKYTRVEGHTTHATIVWTPSANTKITATRVPCGELRVVKEDE
jgi:hypothetical protein